MTPALPHAQARQVHTAVSHLHWRCRQRHYQPRAAPLPEGADQPAALASDVASAANPRNLAAYFGFQLDNQLADISLAAEINRSVKSGRMRGGDDLEFESRALYLRVRTTSSLFVSLRGGYVRDRIVVDGASSERDQGFLIGAGLGVVAGRTRILLEYSSIAGDADFLSRNLEF